MGTSAKEAKERVLEAQRIVSQLEANEIDWQVAFDAVFDQPKFDASDVRRFAAEVYFRFRIAEHAAYHFKKGNPGYKRTGVQSLVDLCTIREVDINQVLQEVEKMEDNGDRIWIEDKLRFGLRILTDFPRWGYGL